MKDKTKKNKTKENNIIIYRLCRDRVTKSRLKKETETYLLPKTEMLSNLDYFEFLRKIIKESPVKFALVCHDDVVLPINIEQRVNEAIRKADLQYGSANWAIIGNAGIEMYTEEIVRYIRDPHTFVIPNKSIIPHISTHIDGNTMLLNISNIREKLVEIPLVMTGFHLYDLVLVTESYKKGLLSLIDSSLYVTHTSKGNQEDFDVAKSTKMFQDYWRDSFINHTIKTINGDIQIEQDYSYLKQGQNNQRQDYYELISRVHANSLSKKEPKTLYLGIRTTLNRIPRLFRLLDSVHALQGLVEGLNIKVIIAVNNIDRKIFEEEKGKIQSYLNLSINLKYIPKDERYYPRVLALKEIVNSVPDSGDNYVWFIDDDDFVIPTHFDMIKNLLHEEIILVADSIVFEESWNSKSTKSIPSKSSFKNIFKGAEFYKTLTGDNYIPLCSVIYPVNVLKEVFEENQLLGDFYEDYSIFLLSQKDKEVRSYPLSIAGISYHGENVSTGKSRTHWDYSHVTFMSEVVNSPIISSTIEKFMENYNLSRNDAAYVEFMGFTKGKIWRYLQIYRSLKRKVINLIKR